LVNPARSAAASVAKPGTVALMWVPDYDGYLGIVPDGAHFDIYVGDAFEKVVADQIALLHRHVPTDH
jgi:hypothetical protein